MLHEIFTLLLNWRFWSFIGIAFSPLWSGIIACGIVMLEQKLGLIED